MPGHEGDEAPALARRETQEGPVFEQGAVHDGADQEKEEDDAGDDAALVEGLVEEGACVGALNAHAGLGEEAL